MPIVWEPTLDTYKKCPAESMARAAGVVPVSVRGLTSVSAPVEDTVYSAIVLSEALETYANFPVGSRTIAEGDGPVAKGEPVMAVSFPEPASIRKPAI